eukprot:scaffold313046_cov37-Tisochrysis_lutea.AAC.3
MILPSGIRMGMWDRYVGSARSRPLRRIHGGAGTAMVDATSNALQPLNIKRREHNARPVVLCAGARSLSRRSQDVYRTPRDVAVAKRGSGMPWSSSRRTGNDRTSTAGCRAPAIVPPPRASAPPSCGSASAHSQVGRSSVATDQSVLGQPSRSARRGRESWQQSMPGKRRGMALVDERGPRHSAAP